MMRINEFVNFSGKVDIEVVDMHGNINLKILVPNLIVSVGKSYIANRLVPAVPFDDITYDPFKSPVRCLTHMSIGSSNENSKVTDVGLRDLKQTASLSSLTVNDNMVTATAVFGPTVGNAFMLAEAGLFNADSNGDLDLMLCRTTFTNVVKTPTDSLNITWTITVA